jgi:8-oxo-dGTP pyrophosphatase MutT (NUDIX family)
MREPREVLVVVRRGEEFLVLHRAPSLGAYWHPVAGGIEAGETAAEAAARELREETGLEADVVPMGRRYGYALRDDQEWRRALFDENVERVEVECFVADAPLDWEPTLNEEHDDFRWCWADEAERLLFWPEPREVLRTLVPEPDL